MMGFSTKLLILGILCRIYLSTTKSNSQNAPIVFGRRAELGQFPWHVIIMLEEIELEICGGSIIGKMWILTAAQCISGHETVYMKFGTIYLEGKHYYSMNSSTFYIHPEFNAVTLESDIALIKLPKELKLNSYIGILDLIPASYVTRNFIGDQGVICGFGDTKDDDPDYSDWLKWGAIKVTTNSICEYPDRYPLSNSSMCGVAWNRSDASPCGGDAGGALVWRRDQTEKFIQIGIISFIVESCTRHPTGYTKVASFLDYINNIIY